MKTKKRFLMVLTLLVVLLMPMNASAASQKTKAVKAYRNFMAKKSASSQFAVAYLDKDSVPELIYYIPSKPAYKVYTWKSGKMKCVYSADHAKDVACAVYMKYYYKKKGVLLGIPYTGAVGISGKMYYAYSGGKYKCKLSRNVSFGDVKYYKISGTKQLKYTPIKSAQFKKSLKSLVGSRKAEKLKYYKNTAANRAKRIK